MRSRVAIWKRRPMCARKPAAGSMIPKARYMTDAWMISSVDRERPRQMSLGSTAAAASASSPLPSSEPLLTAGGASAAGQACASLGLATPVTVIVLPIPRWVETVQ